MIATTISGIELRLETSKSVFNRLVVAGEIYMVIRRRRWYENKLRSIFGGVRVRDVNGYTVLSSEKRRKSYAS